MRDQGALATAGAPGGRFPQKQRKWIEAPHLMAVEAQGGPSPQKQRTMVIALEAGRRAGALLMATVALWPMGAVRVPGAKTAAEVLLRAVPVLLTRAAQVRKVTTVALVPGAMAMTMVAAQV